MQLAEASSSCQTRQILTARMRADLKVYRDAVVTLERNTGNRFLDAHQKAEHARLAYEAARDKLMEHTDSHCCG
jgi:hypothetical protein